jgi:hypothetical protein
LIKPHGPWRTIEQLEFAIFEYIDWWNHRRLHSQVGLIPPAEAEANYYRHTPEPSRPPAPNEPSPYQTQGGSLTIRQMRSIWR